MARVTGERGNRVPVRGPLRAALRWRSSMSRAGSDSAYCRPLLPQMWLLVAFDRFRLGREIAVKLPPPPATA
jgi:hypothetical protein